MLKKQANRIIPPCGFSSLTGAPELPPPSRAITSTWIACIRSYEWSAELLSLGIDNSYEDKIELSICCNTISRKTPDSRNRMKANCGVKIIFMQCVRPWPAAGSKAKLKAKICAAHRSSKLKFDQVATIPSDTTTNFFPTPIIFITAN